MFARFIKDIRYCTQVSKIFVIEDCKYYSTTEYSTATSIPFTISGDCSIEWQGKATNAQTNCLIDFGQNGNNMVRCGLINANIHPSLSIYYNSSYVSQQYFTNQITVNEWFDNKVTIDNGVVNYITADKTYTPNFAFNGLFQATIYNSRIKNIKIKPL